MIFSTTDKARTRRLAGRIRLFLHAHTNRIEMKHQATVARFILLMPLKQVDIDDRYTSNDGGDKGNRKEEM
jgi:hypothetical protein